MKHGTSDYQHSVIGSAVNHKTSLWEASRDHNLVLGIGYELKGAVSSIAKRNPNKKFAIIGEATKGQESVVSANFLSNRASHLAGVAAAYETKTNVVGSIGDAYGDIVDLFDTGFIKGVNDTAKKLDKKITILGQYIGDSNSSDKAKAVAQTMYAKEVDIAAHAVGGAGGGLFEETKVVNQTRKASDRVWAAGVDTG